MSFKQLRYTDPIFYQYCKLYLEHYTCINSYVRHVHCLLTLHSWTYNVSMIVPSLCYEFKYLITCLLLQLLLFKKTKAIPVKHFIHHLTQGIYFCYR